MRTLVLLLAILGLLSGCAAKGGAGPSPADYVKPTIAVMKFENRAPFPLHWELGSGMRDVLVDRLVATKRYHVIERPELDSVVGELKFQQSGMTRPEDRLALGKIKNVRYLVKGTITDFSHVSSSSGFVGKGTFNLFGSGSCAVMGMTMYVVDVESGEIICSESLQESVKASDGSVQVMYKDVAFGGSVFYQTPLGQATEKVIERAVDKITQSIAARPWVARIAGVQGDGSVILNGGRDRELQVGDQFDAAPSGAPIVDPESGDIIGHQEASPVGRLRITRVEDHFSMAAIDSGNAGAISTGLYCRRIGGH